MAVTVKKITLWRTEVKNKPGTLSSVLAPLAQSGANLQVVMGYHRHGAGNAGIIEVSPISGKKSTVAAGKVGLKAAPIPTLLVQGDDRAGLGQAIAEAIAEAGINISFLVAQVVDARFSAVIGFDNETASTRATVLIKKAVKKMAK